MGQFPRHTLADARDWAHKIGRNRDQGIDIIEVTKVREQREGEHRKRTCDWLFEQYMINEGASRRSANEKRRKYRRDIAPAIGDRSYFEITHNDLARILQAKVRTAPTMSNNLQSLIRRMFRWAVTKGRHITDLTVDPAAHLTKLAPARSKERALNDSEIIMLFQVLAQRETPFRAPLLLALHTGVRRGEAFGMLWSELDRARGDWLIPKSRTKTNMDLLLPLPPSIVGMLRNAKLNRQEGAELVWPSRASVDRPLSGFSKITEWLNSKMSALAGERGLTVPHFTIHDFRRTVSTGMNGLLDENDRPKIPPHVVERIMNHKLAKMEGVYNRHAYYAEKKAALRIWADHLASLRLIAQDQCCSSPGNPHQL